MVEISIPAKEYVKIIKEMDNADNGWDAADIMHRKLQLYMSKQSFKNYVDEYYEI